MKVIVVGGGIFGASTAYALVQHGASVTVIDRCDEGRATAAGAGIVRAWLRRTDAAYYSFAERCGAHDPELLASLREDGEVDTGYRRVGSLVVPEHTTELDAVEERLERRRATAPEMGVVRRITPSEAVALFPAMRSDRPALHIEGTGRVNGRLLARAMLNARVKRGGAVIDGSVDAVVRSSGQVEGVQVSGKLIRADARRARRRRLGTVPTRISGRPASRCTATRPDRARAAERCRHNPKMIERLGGSELLHAAVVHGNVIYLSGVTADDRMAGMAAQTRQVLDKIAKWLGHFGCDRSCMLSASIFITDMSLNSRAGKTDQQMRPRDPQLRPRCSASVLPAMFRSPPFSAA